MLTFATDDHDQQTLTPVSPSRHRHRHHHHHHHHHVISARTTYGSVGSGPEEDKSIFHVEVDSTQNPTSSKEDNPCTSWNLQ